MKSLDSSFHLYIMFTFLCLIQKGNNKFTHIFYYYIFPIDIDVDIDIVEYLIFFDFLYYYPVYCLCQLTEDKIFFFQQHFRITILFIVCAS